MESVSVQVPATTANLGPGFDCLGIAVQLWNTIRVSKAAATSEIPPIVREAASLFWERLGHPPFPFSCEIVGDVPRSRGLGSSVTVRLGVLHALNTLADSPADRGTIANLCTELEGHPDNALPAEYGGFVVANDPSFLRFPVDSRLAMVFLIPEDPVQTCAARKILPDAISRKKAAVNVANAGMLVASLASGQYEAMRGCFEDHLHQPFRQGLLPHMQPAIHAGIEAGALGGFLSGSGSAIACMTLENADAVADAMRDACPSTRAASVILRADNEGTRVLAAESAASTPCN